ncbi:hypothetical protein TIN4_64 [Tsukamurella phage TIN4]|uniref:Uncharacterized protein n=2 Tax=Tinduovirus TIN3 TaxID=1982571 RepID=A0A0K0N5I3_9CAUD|nr:hypothetical protein AVT54_gp061 [Tsukamurella phage TIN3]YP_009604194.1 hypothetical protein FDH87_gp061 [Tsukamurella phage TIN4]AKJ71861.1 hypothetical protein TIN3_64 [Tsukamurella phage TIN3]AKJ71970.1 hypothetical protein TIN4_64 [Tsukamurella phage TIN4]
MADPLYACTNCGKDKKRDELTAKKVMFAGIGNASTVFRSRTVDWLCENCLGSDKDYNYPRDMSRTERMKIARTRRKREEES